MTGKRRQGHGGWLARISTIYTHVGGTAAGWQRRRLSRRYFGFPHSQGPWPFPPILLLPHPPAAYHPWLDGLSRRCTFGQGLITVEGSPAYLLLTRKDLVFISRGARCRHCRDYSSLPAIPLIPLWNYDDARRYACARARTRRLHNCRRRPRTLRGSDLLDRPRTFGN